MSPVFAEAPTQFFELLALKFKQSFVMPDEIIFSYAPPFLETSMQAGGGVALGVCGCVGVWVWARVDVCGCEP